jgi:hypothetical protein
MKGMPASRLALLAALSAGLSACVVPAGPEWVDPPGNSPPSIHSATPPMGSVLTLALDAGTPPTVEVVLADKNTKDRLYARWIIDYPPFDVSISRLARPEGLPGGEDVERPALYFSPSCTDHDIAPGFSNHRLLLAVSDRPFNDDPRQTVLDQVPNGNFRIEAVWLFEMDCSP